MNAALTVTGLTKHYRARGRGQVVAVDDVSLSVAAGETLALVGESGSGKTTTGRLILGLERPTSGTVSVAGTTATDGRAAMARARRDMQMVFQDPYESIDPRMRIREAIMEPLRSERGLGSAAARGRVAEMMELVGLDPDRYATRFPHELSGGQRQRVAIARAMISRPRVVVADEPVSMLDVSIRATVLDLMRRVQIETGVSYLFVTHDLLVAQHVSHRIAVMKSGSIVESGPTHDVMSAPTDPYTRQLLAAAPRLP